MFIGFRWLSSRTVLEFFLDNNENMAHLNFANFYGGIERRSIPVHCFESENKQFEQRDVKKKIPWRPIVYRKENFSKSKIYFESSGKIFHREILNNVIQGKPYLSDQENSPFFSMPKSKKK